ncbi:Bug family tripartite tricarboxylate transporter substrate binding protein [Achromobacter aloeverae]|uniref:Tripartite tricarboxylate transporter substrate binding protein n=1 Tax=Achromobacter aloeverae TaxID=1750518 RepID=A0A4Q1HFJ8_9BURK|nr:tripartite tricarboxylate transporter substrate binding protein [Achromobacter aloeverae]RXN84500.1 tripartite tricarboxylate transporter substrate binding protein [Achromobacter aloeverae]
MGDKTLKAISPGRRAWMQRGLALGGAAMLGVNPPARAVAATTAEAWPAGPIRLVVPFPPGGSVDTVARTVGPQLQAQLGQPVVIENRPGASSVMGAQHVKQSKPDGYTILLNASLQVANPVLLATATYDPLNDFVSITEIGAQPQLVVVRADGPYKTMGDLVEDARKHPRHVTWAIAAFGAAGHLACALVNVQAKVDMPIIPYKGGGPALMDVMGGHVSAQIEPMASAYPHVQAGKLRALAVTSAQRLASLPDVPTVAESGFPGFDMPSWYGLWAPAGTPRAIVDRLHMETAKALKVPAVAEKLAAISFIPMGTSPDAFAKYSASELEKYRDLINKAHIKADA